VRGTGIRVRSYLADHKQSLVGVLLDELPQIVGAK
jgi:hypothetical protein